MVVCSLLHRCGTISPIDLRLNLNSWAFCYQTQFLPFSSEKLVKVGRSCLQVTVLQCKNIYIPNILLPFSKPEKSTSIANINEKGWILKIYCHSSGPVAVIDHFLTFKETLKSTKKQNMRLHSSCETRGKQHLARSMNMMKLMNHSVKSGNKNQRCLDRQQSVTLSVAS